MNVLSQSSVVQKSDLGLLGPESKRQQGCIPSRSSRGESLSPASRGPPRFLAHSTFFHLQIHQRCISLLPHFLSDLFDSLMPPSVTFKDPCVHIGPPGILQDNIPFYGSSLTCALSLLTHKVTFTNSRD